MSHTHTKLLYHLVWSTKNREPFITPELEKRVYAYIRTAVKNEGGVAIAINGMPDHVHLLVSLPVTLLLPILIRNIKTPCTKWIRREPAGNPLFEWQAGYGGFTVGYSTMQSTIRYIDNQKIHHQNKSFEQEYQDMLAMQEISCGM